MNSSSLNDAVRIESNPETRPPTLHLIDDIQGVRVQFSTNPGCNPTQCSTDSFLFPVDVAYDLPPLVLWTHRFDPVIVRDGEEEVCTEITNRETASLPTGSYTIDICSLGLKAYLVVKGAVDILPDGDQGYMIDCSDTTSVQLGLRSFHESPTATVTTTDQPRDVMRALSCLGSALKTTTCERSFPTLRGHPPLIERGDRFHAPSELERTDETASVRIEVPPELESIYPVASLAYYLNAIVTPGESACLVTPDTTYPLDQGDGIEHRVAQLLKHVFTLDCITRTEGLYPITLGERLSLEERLVDTNINIDFASLYEQPLSEQIKRYLSVPFDHVEDLVPRWPLTADIRPIPKYLPHVPFVAVTLGTIRCLPTSSPRSTPSAPSEIQAFYRDANAKRADVLLRSVDAASETRSRCPTPTSEDSSETTSPPNIYEGPQTESLTQLWLADGYPIQGAKPTFEAYQRHLDAVPADTIHVAVINNDAAMQAESDVADLYEQRDRVPFEVTIYEQLSRDTLSDVFTDDFDLIHYVGHIDTRGLQCADGWLDAHTLDTVNARAFLLNGCRSYEQGEALVTAGAIGGLCTLTNVGNTPATRIGRTVAQLLNAGFSLAGALDLISENFHTGQQYMIVGDPGLAIVHSQGNTPTLATVTPTPDDDDDMFVVDLFGYPSSQNPIGIPYVPNLGDSKTYHLNSGHITTLEVSRTTLTQYLQQEQFPVQIDGSITWGDGSLPTQ